MQELGSGGNLRTFLKMQPNNRLSETKAKNFAQQLTAAVSHLHERGVVHRWEFYGQMLFSFVFLNILTT